MLDVKVSSFMSDSLWPHGLYGPWNSPGQNTGVDSRSLLHGIFPEPRSPALKADSLLNSWLWFKTNLLAAIANNYYEFIRIPLQEVPGVGKAVVCKVMYNISSCSLVPLSTPPCLGLAHSVLDGTGWVRPGLAFYLIQVWAHWLRGDPSDRYSLFKPTKWNCVVRDHEHSKTFGWEFSSHYFTFRKTTLFVLCL